MSTYEKLSTVVIPIRAKKCTDISISRLERLITTIPPSMDVIIVDDGSNPKCHGRIKELTKKTRHFSYLYLNTRFKQFSLSRCRNRGAYVAKTPVVIFHDVDFIGSKDIYYRIEKKLLDSNIANEIEKFFCIPVAFLSEEGTSQYINDLSSSENIEYWTFKDEEQPSGKNLLHFVRGSSCIAVNRQHLLNIGGHDESFYGHGAEDFELLHRLSEAYPIGERPIDYEVNTGSGPIKEYRGFRAYFALYGNEFHKSGCTLVHLFHPKRKNFGYYKHKRNFAKLKKLMTNK